MTRATTPSRRPRESATGSLLDTRAWASCLLLLLAMGSAAAAQDPEPRQPETHALLLNGGQTARINYRSHLHHLEDMLAELRRRGLPPQNIHVFSGDGADPAEDMAVRGLRDPRFWLLEGTSTGNTLYRVGLENTEWEGIEVRPAVLTELGPWFDEMGERLAPGSTLFLFVTDHGKKNAENPENTHICLWNEEVTAEELRELLGFLQPGVRVVQVMSQCYSGGFASTMSPGTGALPDGGVCGFYSTYATRRAHGCYPEGRDRDSIGHASRFIEAMARHATLSAAHEEVLVTDMTPNVPLRTSDIFLERALEDEAERREMSFEALGDLLLEEGLADRDRWQPELLLLDRIATAYGTFSPRRFRELATLIEQMEALSEAMDTYEGRWKGALRELRQRNLDSFLAGYPGWDQRLKSRETSSADDRARREILDALLTELEEFTRDASENWDRLQRLRSMHTDSRRAKYRIDTRLAAMLRMRAVLVQIAGRRLLEGAAEAGEGGRPSAFGLLTECEATLVGDPVPVPDAGGAVAIPDPLPPFETEKAVLQRVLPSWLGIRYRAPQYTPEEGPALLEGAVEIMGVVEGSPAEKAGIRLWDIILGPPGEPFREPRQIREWIMFSPRETEVPLTLLRDGEVVEVSVVLQPYPVRMPSLPDPPRAGDPAPPLGELDLLRGEAPADLTSRPHALFFWSPGCLPCEESVPELLEWSRNEGVLVLAVTDEAPARVLLFLEGREDPFPEVVVSDRSRELHVSYGVSATPTFVLVGTDGAVGWRQKGYSAGRGLSVTGAERE